MSLYFPQHMRDSAGPVNGPAQEMSPARLEKVTYVQKPGKGFGVT